MSSLGENDDGEVLEQIASLARRRVLAEFERCELAGDLEDWVGPWFGDEALRERLARHVADGKGVARLRNFLDAAVADELHDELAGTTDWERRAEARPKYQYRFDALSDHRPARFFHASRPTLRRLYGFFNAPAAKKWAERLLRAAWREHGLADASLADFRSAAVVAPPLADAVDALREQPSPDREAVVRALFNEPAPGVF